MNRNTNNETSEVSETKRTFEHRISEVGICLIVGIIVINTIWTEKENKVPTRGMLKKANMKTKQISTPLTGWTSAMLCASTMINATKTHKKKPSNEWISMEIIELTISATPILLSGILYKINTGNMERTYKGREDMDFESNKQNIERDQNTVRSGAHIKRLIDLYDKSRIISGIITTSVTIYSVIRNTPPFASDSNPGIRPAIIAAIVPDVAAAFIVLHVIL